MILHNICGHGHCRHTECKGCGYTNYYLVVGEKEYHLPNWMQFVLRKIY